jgi:hypothetical protein
MSRFHASARGLFEQATKAGLGVGFGAIRDGGVEIGTVVAEIDRFPAAAMLMPGDVVVGADGRNLSGSDDLRAIILSHEPGETLNVLVRRGERVLDMDLPLGSYSSLRGAAPIDRDIADRAIAIRWARQGISLPITQSLGEGIDPSDWINAGYPEDAPISPSPRARRMDRLVSPGSARDVYVGIGVMRRGRIEPWSNKENAINAMGQARRIQIIRSMDVANKRIQILKIGIDMLSTQIKQDGTTQTDDPAKFAKLKGAREELRAVQDELEVLTVEFQAMEPSPYTAE